MIASVEPEPQRQPDLELAVRCTLNEVADTAETLASLAPFVADLGQTERLIFLHKLAGIGRRLRAASVWLCDTADRRTKR
jgi:hypothetical protein